MAQMVKNLLQCRKVSSLGQEDPLEREMATHASILAWKMRGQRSLAGYSSWDDRESDTTEHLTLSMCQAVLWAPQEGDEPLPHNDGVF